MKTSALALSLLLCAALPARASEWLLDAMSTRITFEGQQSGAAFSGQIPSVAAKIIFDPTDLPKASISADLALVGISTGSPMRDEALPQAEWLDLQKFPTAHFESRNIRQTGEGQYEAQGTLTLRGTTQPLLLPFTLVIDGNKAHATSTFTLNRLLYNIGSNWPADGEVGGEVKVMLDLEATRAP